MNLARIPHWTVIRVGGMYYDIVILPPSNVRDAVGRAVGRTTRGREVVFAVDNRTLTPHLSLFHIRTSNSGIREVAATVAKVLTKYRAPLLRSRGIALPPGTSTLSLRLTKPAALERLHHELVSKCRGFRTGQMPWTNRTRLPTRTERLYRDRYGTQHVLRFFAPHLTLAKFADPQQALTAAREMRQLRSSFVGDTVAICEVDFWHQVTSVGPQFVLRH